MVCLFAALNTSFRRYVSDKIRLNGLLLLGDVVVHFCVLVVSYCCTIFLSNASFRCGVLVVRGENNFAAA